MNTQDLLNNFDILITLLGIRDDMQGKSSITQAEILTTAYRRHIKEDGPWSAYAQTWLDQPVPEDFRRHLPRFGRGR